MYLLGISCYYHDAAAALIRDDEIIAAAQEERFSRKKHDLSFPVNAIKYCLKEANIDFEDLERIVFYDNPNLKFRRILSTYIDFFPRSIPFIYHSLPVWLFGKLHWKKMLIKEFSEKLNRKIEPEIILNRLHHTSHAGSAFYPSPFQEAAVLVLDGVGELATTSIYHGKGSQLNLLKQIDFPHSLGLLYSAFTYYTGFKVNSGEYKLMGLAPYGEAKYTDTIKKNLIKISHDGTFYLDMKYFDYAVGSKMTNEKFHNLFGKPPRKPESALTQFEMDLAASIQEVTEEVMIKLANHAREATNSENLCLAGGVALNCVGNGKILKENIFKNLWIQPAAGDAGGALGAALSVYYEELKKPRIIDTSKIDNMQGAYLGPRFADAEIREYLDSIGAVYEYIPDENMMIEKISDALLDEKVIGWHNGRMEFGPRALGARSIIGDARSAKMQSVMNLKIKYRESFRPFAPSVLREKVSEWFELDVDSPYMLLVAPVKKEKCKEMREEQKSLFGIEKLNIPRSEIPAVTHIDYSARIQTVHKETNPKYHKLIYRFYEKSECPVIVNTSFNVRGEPIVCTPEDSYRCFMRTDMDVLMIDNFILYKEQQPKFKDSGDWRSEFELD